MKKASKWFGIVCGSCFWIHSIFVVSAQTVRMETTDRLTVCVEEAEINEAALLPVIRKFQDTFPEVELEIEKLPEVIASTPEYEAVRQAKVDQIKTEVMSGGGPDLFVLSVGVNNYTLDTENLFKDLEKSARTGIFADLGTMLEADETIDLEAFYPFVKEAGTVDGKLVLFPLSYYAPAYVTTQKNLEEIGFDRERAQDSLEAFHDEMVACLTQEQMIFARQDYYQNLASSLLDYDTGKIHMGGPEKTYFEWYKQESKWAEEYQKSDEATYYDVQEAAYKLSEGTLPIISGAIGSSFGVLMTAECMATSGEDAVFLFLPDENGEGVAYIDSYAAINANSLNQKNALEFLKILISEEMQIQGYGITDSMPVRRGHEILRSVASVRRESQEGAFAIDRAELSDMSIASYADVLEHLKTGRIQQMLYLPISGSKTFQDYLKQYVEDAIEYEEFAAIVEDGLTFYWEE